MFSVALGSERREDEAEARYEESGPTQLASEQRLVPSAQLAKIVGSDALTKAEVIQLVWEYIEKHGLQDRERPTRINCDEVLMAVAGAPECTMFSLPKLISGHLH